MQIRHELSNPLTIVGDSHSNDSNTTIVEERGYGNHFIIHMTYSLQYHVFLILCFEYIIRSCTVIVCGRKYEENNYILL